MKFTQEQLQVIRHEDFHARVTAVAGSGKTATLVERIAFLINEKAVDPSRILVLMFNRSAAEEFSVRLNARLHEIERLPKVSTFHSMGLRVLNQLVEERNLPQQSLGKPYQLQQLAKQALANVQHQSVYNLDKSEVELLEQFIDLAKSSLQAPSVTYENVDSLSKSKDVLTAFSEFERLRNHAGLYFYSDMIYLPIQHLSKNKEERAAFEGLFDHILIDEYQDINDVQQSLVKLFASDTASVLAVGDADQCIYEWRGAKPGYLLKQFTQDFPCADSYTLSRSFRYGHALSIAANNVITKNAERDNHLVVSDENTPDTKLYREEYADYNDVYRLLLKTINQAQADGQPLSQVAIIARLYSSLAQPELALLQMGIPYRIEGSVSVVNSEVTRFVMACMMLASDEIKTLSNAEYFQTAVDFMTFPRTGLPAQALADIANAATQQNRNLGPVLNTVSQNVKYYQAKRIRERLLLLHVLATSPVDASELMNKIEACISLRRSIQEQAPNVLKADEQTSLWSTLQNIAKTKKYNPLEFARELDSAAVSAQMNDAEHERDAVTLMSAHRAKGLEWDTVIIPNLEKDKFPYQHHDAAEDNTEAERRLFYVAMTRARKSLTLLVPKDPLFDFTDQGMESDKAIFSASRFAHEAAIPLAAKTAETITEKVANQPQNSTRIEQISTRYRERLVS